MFCRWVVLDILQRSKQQTAPAVEPAAAGVPKSAAKAEGSRGRAPGSLLPRTAASAL